jgi:hypothetical protein
MGLLKWAGCILLAVLILGLAVGASILIAIVAALTIGAGILWVLAAVIRAWFSARSAGKRSV